MLEYIIDEDEEEDLYKPKTVLIIENDSMYRNELVQLLQNKGYRVETAKEGFEGIRKYEKIKPDAVIINKNLPNMEGIITARLLRKHYPSSKIIMTAPYPLTKPDLGFGSYKGLNRNETYRLGKTLKELLEEEYKKYNSYS